MGVAHRATACCAIIVFSFGATAAEVPIPNDTVEDRVRDEFEPAGIRRGGFTVFPSASLSAKSDDNIYADPDDEVSDIVTTLAPKIEIRSNWPQHAFELEANSRLVRHADNPTEDFDDVEARLSGSISITQNSELVLEAGYESLHEERFSPDDRGGFAPTGYSRSRYSVDHEYRSHRAILDLGVRLVRIDFDDAEGLDGPINNDDRDRDISEAVLRAGYVVSPATTIFMAAGYESVDYDSSVDDNGFARSADSREVSVGAELDVSERSRIEGRLGWKQRSLDDLRLADLEELQFDARFIYRLSGLTTLSASASRDLEETTFESSSGFVETRVGIGLDHELLRNLVVKLRAYHENNDYKGIDRREDIMGGLIGAHYMMNRNLDLILEVRGRDRDVRQSFAGDDGYESNVIELRIVGKM